MQGTGTATGTDGHGHRRGRDPYLHHVTGTGTGAGISAHAHPPPRKTPPLVLTIKRLLEKNKKIFQFTRIKNMKMYYQKKEKSAQTKDERLKKIADEVKAIEDLKLSEQLDDFLKLHKSEVGDDVHVLKPKHGAPVAFVRPKDLPLIAQSLISKLWKEEADVVLDHLRFMGAEMDILSVTKGRAIEYAIKTTRKEYFASFREVVFSGKVCNKHGMISAGKAMVSQFYFVVPDGMISEEECPQHAGLIYFSVKRNVVSFDIKIEAKKVKQGYLTEGAWQRIAKDLMAINKALLIRLDPPKTKATKRECRP